MQHLKIGLSVRYVGIGTRDGYIRGKARRVDRSCKVQIILVINAISFFFVS